MKGNNKSKFGEEINVENENAPTCGSDADEFLSWDQSVSQPYIYNLFSSQKDKIDISSYINHELFICSMALKGKN